jgi:hypothetical protein
MEPGEVFIEMIVTGLVFMSPKDDGDIGGCGNVTGTFGTFERKTELSVTGVFLCFNPM